MLADFIIFALVVVIGAFLILFLHLLQGGLRQLGLAPVAWVVGGVRYGVDLGFLWFVLWGLVLTIRGKRLFG